MIMLPVDDGNGDRLTKFRIADISTDSSGRLGDETKEVQASAFDLWRHPVVSEPSFTPILGQA